MTLENKQAPIFDSHAHYDSDAFNADRDELLKGLLGGAVSGIINCGSDIKTSLFSLSLAKWYNGIYAAVGVHPQEISASGAYSDETEKKLTELLADKKAVAVGEIGLDYHYDCAGREEQLLWFEKQLILAKELSKPVIIHDREAHADTMRLINKYRPHGVVHCFSGSVEMMREVIRAGMYIGLGGAVTFKNAKTPLEVAREVPCNRFLTETDCPYMTPVPFRGKRNDSSLIRFTAEKIAEVRGTDTDSILLSAAENARELFSL